MTKPQAAAYMCALRRHQVCHILVQGADAGQPEAVFVGVGATPDRVGQLCSRAAMIQGRSAVPGDARGWKTKARVLLSTLCACCPVDGRQW